MSTPPYEGPPEEGRGGDPWATPPPPPGSFVPGAVPPPGQAAPPWAGPGQQPSWEQAAVGWGGGQAGAPTTPTNGMAVAALVASILGLLTLWMCGIGVVGVVVGLVLGYLSRGQIRSSGGTQGGDGIATAAIVVGWIGAAFVVLGVVLFFVFGLLGAFLPLMGG
ncbi:MAG TPA: DUF4190 domain-containing protein [Egibacteraceae bacterium]|nr:DUF4190 domain-containing protein [Egibacteraceae bacterium]